MFKINFLKKIALSSCMLVAGCGFHLRGLEPLPTSLQNIYLTTNDQYGAFTKDLRNQMKWANVKLAANRLAAPITLHIIKTKWNNLNITTGDSTEARVYIVKMDMTYQLESSKGIVIYGPQTLSINQQLILNANQLLDNNDQYTNLQESMRVLMMQRLFEVLSSEATQKAIQAKFRDQKK